MNKIERRALIRERHQARAGWMAVPADLPTLDELPEADVHDLIKVHNEMMEVDCESIPD